MNAFPIAFVGSANLDHIAVVPRVPGSDERVVSRQILTAGGGPAATAAVAARRQGIETSFFGRVGDDYAGRLVQEGLLAEGIDLSGLFVQPGMKTPESILLIEAESGFRSIVTEEVAPADLSVHEIGDFPWVHIDHVGYFSLEQLHRQGKTIPRVSLDGGNPISGLRLDFLSLYAPTASQLLQRYSVESLEEAVLRAFEEGPEMVVATAGKDGAWYFDGKDFGHVPAFFIDVKSTLGAGDVFHGALVAEVAQGRDLKSAVVYASATAALSCAGIDGRSMIPDREKVQSFITSAKGT